MNEIKELKRFIDNLKQLPTISPIALRIVEVSGEEGSSIGEITKLIESDQALSAKILQISNYTLAKSDRQGEARTVKHAAAILGMDMIRSIALSLIVVNLFESSSDKAFNVVEFWRHSAACAIAGELLARKFAYPQPEEAFIAGLLHDLGKLIFFHWKKTEYGIVVQEAKLAKTRLLEYEEKNFKIGHSQAAKLLMEYWNFPQPLINAAWLHHQPISEFGSNRKEQLPFIIKCANVLCHMQRFGDGGNSIADLDSEQLRMVTGLSSEEIDSLSSEVLSLFEEVAKNYDWKGDTPDLYLSAVSRANQELFQKQIELREVKQQLIIQQNLNKLRHELHESLSITMPVIKALGKVVDMLGEVIPYKRIMGFVLMQDKEIMEGWLKLNTKSSGEPIILSLNEEEARNVKHMRLREQISFIEHAIEKLEGVLSVGSEVLKALHSENLKVQPMYIGGKTIGLIMIELEPFNWSQHEKSIFLRAYALTAATEIDRLIMIESMDQQMEERAQNARKIEDLQTRVCKAEQLSSVGLLTAGAAHEINNPLAAISIEAQLLLKSINDEKQRNSVQSIINQTTRISKIINDLIGIAKPVEPMPELTDIELIINNILEILESRIALSDIKVIKNIEPNMPQINVDPKQMEKVFLNLTINAIQAMEKSGELIINVKTVKDKEMLQIEFSDTGMGIEANNISKIFDPFYSSKKEGERSGLGLTICKSIVKRHNGEINVSSEPGQGSTFSIYLPLCSEGSSNFVAETTTESQHPETRIDEGDISVLIADDEIMIREPLTKALTAEGYQVDSAVDGAECLDKLNKSFFDVILLDLRMPEKDGLEVLETIKAGAPPAPQVIVITGISNKNELDAAKDAGAFACIKKPFDINELLSSIKSAISQKQ